jgi:predicted NBD/HSP70 family sugar kinase
VAKKFLSQLEAADLNRNRILNYIRTCGPVSRTDIWKNNGLSRASVTYVMQQLLEMNMVVETEKGESKSGRKPLFIEFNPNARLIYLYDWIEEDLHLVNLFGETICTVDISLPSHCIPEKFAQAILKGIQRIRHKTSLNEQIVLGLGLIMPGLIDNRNQVVLFSVELGWRNIDLNALFSGLYGGDIFLERISDVIALGESEFGKYKGAASLLTVIFNKNGIGVSMVTGNNSFHGSNHMFGELGHIKLNSDIVCSCGQKGCLEAVVYHLMDRNGGVVDHKVVDYLSIAISTVINVVDSEVVLLCGEMIENIDPQILLELYKKIKSRVINVNSRKMILDVSENYRGRGIQGMCVHILNECFPLI